jgi:GTP cyclohydrolase I
MSHKKIILTHLDIEHLCLTLGAFLADQGWLNNRNPGKCYPIPRGGIPAAYALASQFNIDVVDNPAEADFFFDDIIDSGATLQKWCDEYPGKTFLALIDKTDTNCKYKEDWIVFPWEGTPEAGVEDNIRRILEFAGDDPSREGLLETPHRVAKALNFWFQGYGQKPEDVLKAFEDGAENCDEMVIVKDIPFYSKCEHHMADIFGTASIAYIPQGKIVGLSKLSRLLDVFARRLQVQERLTNQVADALIQHLDAKGAGVVIKARHMCMESRGVCKQGHYTITSALRGAMREQPETRAEFMSLVK